MKKQFVLMFFFVALSFGFLSAGVTVGWGKSGFESNQFSTGTFLVRVDIPIQTHFFALRYVVTGEILSIHTESEISGLYELLLTRRSSPLMVTVSAGIGMFSSKPFLFIPLEVQLFTKSQGAQLGVVLLTNINGYNTYWGWTIALHFGRSKY